MDFSFTPEQEKLRVDIGEFLENNLTSEYKNVLYDVAGVGVSKEFTKIRNTCLPCELLDHF